MKHFTTRALLLLLALTWLLPQANAQVSLSSTTPVAKCSTSGWTGSSGNLTAQIAVSNDVVYTIMTGGTLISYWNASNGQTGSFPNGSTLGANGPGICTDDNGNLVIASGPMYNQRLTQITVIPKSSGIGVLVDPAQAKNISLSNKYTTTFNNGTGVTNVIRASGNCYNGTGALWLTDGLVVVKIPIVNGVAQAQSSYTAPSSVTVNGTSYYFGGNSNSSWNKNSNFFPYGDNKYMLINRNGTFLCSLSGSTVNLVEYVDKLWYLYNAADIANIGGHEIIVHQSADGQTRNGKITIKDRTDGKTLASAMNAYGTAATPSSSAGATEINAWCEFSPISSGQYGLYTYVPGAGFAKYIIKYTTQDPVQNLAVEIVKDQDPSQLSRQDAILTWEAPAKGTVSKYTIYCRENPWFSMEGNGVDSDGDGYSDGPQWRQDTWSAWKELGSTTELTFTDIDVCMYGSSIPRSYQYKVVPTFSTGTTGAESNVIEITPGFVPFVPVWDTTMDQDDKKYGIDRYDGYCKIQLYWTFPQVNNYDYFPSGQKNVYGVKPDYYSILRNGKEIATNITCYNYIDTDVKSEQTYTYEVVSHYYDFPNDTAVSSPNTVYVAKRDWAKVGYELTEIYNYKIAASGTNVHIPASSYSNITSTPGSYYQGAYHNGYWYIGQLNDGTSSTTSGGGIIKISAADPKDNANENILKPGTKYKSFSYWLTNGIASDDEGNLFVQSSTFGSRLKTGTIYMNNGSSYTVNLSGIDLTKYNERDPSKYLTTSSGRVDYYSMKGNLRTKGEAYLYLAPSISRAVFVVKLKYTGSAVTAELVNEFANTEGRRRRNNEPFLQNNENLAFPVRCTGRENEFLHLIRSSALVAMKQNNSSSYATPDSIIYDTQSRINTPGGCTIEFNGELFLITPTSQYSVNKGNFYIGMAERKSSSDTPAQANWGHIIPVIQHQQADAEDGGGNASGTVSIFAEVGKEDVNGDKILNDYIDIYLYAPNGLRFAKYRLTPSNAFPPSQVTLDVKPVYAEERDAGINPGGDIERFDATATWSQVVDYGVTTEQGNIYYKISSYTLQLVDAAGNPISEKDEESGNLLFPAIEFDVNENHVPTAVYTVTFDANGNKTRIPVAEDSNLYKNLSWKANDEGVMIYSYVYKDVKKGFDYTALVTVNYLGNDQSNQGVSQKSQKTEYESSNTYEPEEATGVVLVDVKKGNWGDWNGNGKKDEGDAYYDNYRVCLKLANPDFGKGEVYPRSYYTIGIDKDKNGTIDQEVTNFHLYIGVGNSIETKAYKALATTSADIDGYIEITDGQISGDYDFDQSTNGKPHVYWDMKDYTAPASYNDGVTYTDSDNPSTWNYIVTTHYAAGNSRISEAVTSPMGANNGGITTGVEVISTQSVLNVYPIPATINITIKCSEAIENIEIYSTAGVMVKSIAGNGEQIETINVSDLAAGYYFMRVNNLDPIKIIKN